MSVRTSGSFARGFSLIGRRQILTCCTVLVALAAVEDAAAHDGAIRWRTLQTAHAQIHFPANRRALARHTADVFEDGWAALTPVFNYRPATPVHVTIDDYSDDANGFATPRPFDRIHMRAYPPRWIDDLAGHGDWVRLLIFHELAHVLHLGHHGGVAKVVNAVVGRTYLPNQYLPRLLVEGIAVWAETRHRGFDRGGRGRIDSPQYMMKLRAFVLDNALPELDELTGRPLKWPRGNGWYLFGSVLVDYQVRRYGQAKLIEFIAAYGSRPVPYAINQLYRQIYGISAVRMWRDAMMELRRRVRREHRLRDHGITPSVRAEEVLATHVPTAAPPAQLPDEGTRVTFTGEAKGRIRLHPTLPIAVYVRAPNDGLARVEAIDLRSRRVWTLRVCELSCHEPVFSPDGLTLWWSESRPWHRLYAFEDTFRARVVGDVSRLSEIRRVTVGARVRQLRAPSGRRGRDVHGAAPNRTVAAADVRRGYDPQGSWALVDTGSFRDLACRGQVILRARRGIRSFAVDEARNLAVTVSPHSVGDEIHIAQLPTDWRERCVAGGAPTRFVPPAIPPTTRAAERAYSPWAVMRPRRWQPVVAINGELSAANTTLGLTFDGRDAVNLHEYEVLAQTDLELEKPLVTGSWVLRAFEPTWSFAGSWVNSWTWLTRGPWLYWLRDRRLIGRVAGSWRYPWLRDAIDVSAAYRVAHHQLRNGDRARRLLQSYDPFGPVPREPFTGTTSLLSVGASWGRSERYSNSIATEKIWRYSVFLSYASPLLLSQTPQLRGDLHAERAWPLGGHRVLQWRGRVGWGRVYADRGTPYSIAGLPDLDPQALLFGGAGQDFSVVRGFEQPAGDGVKQLQGHALAWSSLQVHLPLRDLGRGFDTLPFFLGRLWLVVFADGAAVWDRGETKRAVPNGTGWTASAGAELRFDLEVGYVSQGALVLGAARAFGDVSSGQWYLRLAP